MLTLITVLQVIACVLVIAFVLLQPAKGGSFFTGSTEGVFGSSGGTTFLFRATMWLVAFLMISCLYVSRVKVKSSQDSIITMPATSATIPDSAPTAITPKAAESSKAATGEEK